MLDPSKKTTIPPEWAPHKAMWTAWPSHPNLWKENLEGARAEVAAMVRVLADDEDMKVLACGEEAMASARAAIGDCARIIPANFGDIWVRDTGPIFAFSGERPVALRFVNNGWGNKYVLPGDNTVGDAIALAAGVETVRFDFVLEGGAVEMNGEGWLFSTMECVLNANRNYWEEKAAIRALHGAFQCSRVSWLENGLMNDHTDGHIDNLLRFIARNVVVIQLPSGDDDPNAELYLNILKEVQTMNVLIQCIQSPGRICDDDGRVMPASHLNFVIGNKAVVIPVYDEEYGNSVVAKFKDFFPKHNVVGLPSKHLLSGGGSFHCITQQEPAAPDFELMRSKSFLPFKSKKQ